ncbi:MAG: PAS domain-containing protein, partial [Burkholderiaceae bacterium]
MKVLSLKIRFALAMSAIVLALVVGLAAFALHHAKKDLLTEISGQQLALVSQAGDDLDGKLKLAMDALTATAATIPVESLDSTAKIRAVLTERAALRAIFDDVQIMSIDGIIRGDVPSNDKRIGLNVGSRAYFKRVIATAQPTISEPVASKLDGEPIVIFASPIKTGDTIIAVLVGIMRLNKPNLVGHLSSARIGQSGYFELVSTWPKPQFVVHPDPGNILQEFSASDSRALEKVLNSGTRGTSVSTLEDGSKALIAYRPLAMTNWILVAVLPSEEAFGLIEVAKDRSFTIAIISALVLVPMIWLLAWGMLRPLSRLRDQVDRLAEQPDEQARVSEGRNDETGQLARAFNRLLERQSALEALRRASEHGRMRLTRILDHSRDFVATIDTKGRVTYINAAGRAARGIGLDQDVSGTNSVDYHPPWAWKKIEQEGVPAALAHGAWLGETAVLGAGGREIPIDHTLIAHRGATGAVEFFSSTMHDISDAKAASIAIRQSEERMASISDSVPMLIAFMDRECRYRFVNSRCEEFLGRPRSEILGKTLREIAGDEAASFYGPYFARAAAGETLAFDRERIDARHSIHFKVKIIPQFDQEQGLIGFHFLHQDVTDYKVEQQRLSQLVAIDRLTGLANRSGFEAALTEAMHRSAITGNRMALI